MNNQQTLTEQIELLCVGDVTLDIFLHIEKESEFVKFDASSNLLSFLSGSKIMADKVSYLPGGNANNVAVGTKRLGINSEIIAETGSDEFSDILIHHLKNANVNISHLYQNPSASATFSVNLFYINEKIIFIHHVIREHNLDLENLNPKNIFLTSVGENWESLYQKTLSLKKTTNAKLFFNPGSHQLIKGAESFKDVLTLTDILFVNKEEAEKILFDKINNSQINDLLNGIKKTGVKNVCITDGARGAYFLDEKDNFYSQDAISSKIINKTGAGDAFTSGFLGAYLKSNDIKTCLKWGSLNSKSVMEKVGAQTGLLQLEQMESNF